MLFFGEHEIVRDTDGDGARQDDGKDEERVQPTKAAYVEVHVYTTIIVEDKVANSVRPLDRIRVRIKRVEKPTIMLRNELARAGICP
jgi:hypothetical protein